MKTTTLSHSHGTFLKTRGPWSVFHSAKAICPDGKARVVSRIALVADSFFSIPAGMRIKGKYYSGFLYFSDKEETKGAVMFSAGEEKNKEITSV